ncbi:MAG TPA: site-specific DNA-methyltransferase [Fervidobacterium sp.]|nr:site-specific DNA-methyltransferase [Fervidobacterium sp.]
MKFLEVLEGVLKQDDRFVGEDDRILKAKVYDACMRMDGLLLGRLMDNETLKSHFFVEVNGVLVFDKMKFAWVLESREFLPDSYTMFKNKIGLADSEGKLISQQSDVTLVWPYKDCVLEGGQTKEDQKRNEIFYNETLAPDEVNRLLYPKVFTNAKRYSKNGVEDITEIDDADNLIIKGNNLLALASLLRRYEGEVKCIYIDPPYNTGNDSFGYNDSFNQSTWLTFMKNRILLAHDILNEDGSIYVQIDNNMAAYLKVLMDEIFGKNNFQSEIIWVLKGASGYKSLVNNYVRGHDTILFYTKSPMFTYNKQYLPYNEAQLKRFSSVDKDGRRYKTITSTRRLYLDEAKGVPLTDVWDDIASFQTIVNSPELIGFSTQKPERLIQRILSCSTNEGDLVLDFCLGSGTTAAVAHKMGRQYIGVEQMDYINTVTVPRLQKVIEGEQGGISKEVNWQGGGSFVYFELMEQNETIVSELQAADTSEAVQAILNRITDDGLIIPSVLPDDLRSHMDEFAELPLEQQKKLVMELIDKNKLYVNLCDMDDEELAVSDADKAFTRSFYRMDERGDM